MSTWKNRLRSSNSCPNMADNPDTNFNMDTFKLNFLESLSDDSIIKKYQEIIAPLFKPLEVALKSANAEISQLKSQMAEKDATISALAKKVSDLEIHQDDLEEQGRKASIRVFGIPEDTPGNTDSKILSLFNKNMSMEPPIGLENLEVTHCVGRPPAAPNPDNDSAESPPKPRRSLSNLQAGVLKAGWWRKDPTLRTIPSSSTTEKRWKFTSTMIWPKDVQIWPTGLASSKTVGKYLTLGCPTAWLL